MTSVERHDVAVIGIGCRFPGGVNSPDSFWRLLRDGGNAVGDIPADRMDVDALFDPRPATPGRIMSRRGGFLSGLEEFDAEFFGISPREAERLDPQQRLVLETAWEAFEDAGLRMDALAGEPVGVFVGQWLSDFEARLFANPDDVDFHMTTGSGRYATSGRVSYAFGFTGPSLTIDTACSSSLAAVLLAARSVRSGESPIAVAAGVNVIMQPHITIAYSQSRMMAPDGQCKFGDARGDGYVRSEGCGVVVLRRLADAIAAGDRIYAVVRGGALNNDGRTSGSLGTPSRDGQRELLRRAYADAGVPPQTVRYVEAHGTGTRAGDPVELGALSAVLGADRPTHSRCFVGSVKTNIGHTEGAAGVAGFIKCALALHHDAIPRSLHFTEPNPSIPWAETPFEVPRATSAWPGDHSGLRIAAVSAFGIAGSNAHVVLEQAPSVGRIATTDESDIERAHALVLSARAPEALTALADAYAALLEGDPAPRLGDVCASTQRLRTHLERRAVFVAIDRAAMTDQLRRFGAGELDAASARGSTVAPNARKIAFVFPGQGSQWIGMARELVVREPAFREALTACEESLRQYVDWSLSEQLSADATSPAFRMDDIAVIQPVLLAVEIALAALWRSWGIEPDAVVGHSMGEAGAAYLASALSLDDCMRVICKRSALMRRASGHGAMAVVELAEIDAQHRIEQWTGRLSIAVCNSPRSTVVSGEPDAVREFLDLLEAEGVFGRQVKVDVASHSVQMDPFVPELVAEMRPVSARVSAIPLYSTVEGRRIDGTAMGAVYWGHNLRDRVRFGDAIAALLDDGVDCFIEMSPHPVLTQAIQQTCEARGKADVVILGSLRRAESEQASMVASVGALWAAGHPVEWRRVTPLSCDRSDLPTYPWQRKRYWHAAASVTASATDGTSRTMRHPALGTRLDLANPHLQAWRLSIDERRVPWMAEHRVHGATLLPATAVVELFVAAAATVFPTTAIELFDVSLDHVTYIVDGRADVQVECETRDGFAELALWAKVGDEWRCQARSRGRPIVEPAARREGADLFTAGKASTEFYGSLAKAGAAYGEALRGIAEYELDANTGVARLVPADAGVWPFCPQHVDAAIQLVVASSESMRRDGTLAMPRSIASVRVWPGPPMTVTARATWKQLRGGGSAADVVLADDEQVRLEIRGLALRELGADAAPIDPARWLYRVEWQEAERGPADRRGPWLIVGPGTAATELADGLGLDAVTASAIDGAILRGDGGGRPWRGVVLLVGGEDVTTESPANMLTAVEKNIRDVAAVVREIDRAATAQRPRLWLVTRGAQSVDASDAATLALSTTPIWGLARAVESEHADFFGGIIDLDAMRPVSEQAESLCAVVSGAFGEERWLAVRGAQVRVARLTRTAATISSHVWRTDGTWLVTGGLGGVGAHAASWLIERGARRLLIVGRATLPPREVWHSIGRESLEYGRIETLLELERMGAEVHYRSVDVSDPTALTEVLDRWREQSRPRVRGVLHAAGATGDQLLGRLDDETLQRTLAGKVGGAWAAHRALPDVEAFIAFSSIATVLATPGQGAYAAANAFLDALAHRLSAAGRHAVSVSWGVWAGTGFAASDGGRRTDEALARVGMQSFAPNDGLNALDVALRAGSPHVVVVPADWSRAPHLPLFAALRESLTDRTRASTESNEEFKTLVLDASSEQRRELLEATVLRHASSVLKTAAGRLDPARPLGAQGLDSLMGLEVRRRLEGELGLALSATIIWNYPTARRLAAHLAERFEDQIIPSPIVADATASQGSVEVGDELLSGIAAMSDEAVLAALRTPGAHA